MGFLLKLHIQKWFWVQNENIYYIDVSDENKNKQILNKLDNLDSFNMEYPLLYKIENGSITKEIFKCEGFNCSKWYNFSK